MKGVYGTLKKEAKERVALVAEKLREDRSLGRETYSEDDSSSVEYHMKNILKSGGGVWNERKANDYIDNLEIETVKNTRHLAYRGDR